MKYALVEGLKESPKPNLEGVCAFCGARLIPKCGEIKLWHWAHHSKRDCDVWWENETEWHRGWKNNFPIEWQEVIHYADDGEKHIADVKTKHNCVLEIQHSFISNNEKHSRNSFYPNIVWVVDGLRRKRDKNQFFKALDDGVKVLSSPLLIKILSDESRLVKEWGTSNAPVFFDFGEEKRIWWLLPFNENGWSYVVPFSRENFIDFHLGKMDRDFLSFLNKCIHDYGELFKKLKSNRHSHQRIIDPRRLSGFQRYLSRRRSRRL